METEISVRTKKEKARIYFIPLIIGVSDLSWDNNKKLWININIVYQEDSFYNKKILQSFNLENEKYFYYKLEELLQEVWDRINTQACPEETDDRLYREEIHKVVDKIEKEIERIIKENNLEEKEEDE